MQQLDLLPLIDVAAKADVVVAFRVGVGGTLHEGTPLADIHGGDVTGRGGRTSGRPRSGTIVRPGPDACDPLLADIALRALSPAVNDPATAVDALDATEGLLRELTTRDIDVREVTDTNGQLRVHLHLPTWSDYLREAIADLVPPATPFAMVLARVDRLLAELAETAPPAAQPDITRLHASVRARSALAT